MPDANIVFLNQYLSNEEAQMKISIAVEIEAIDLADERIVDIGDEQTIKAVSESGDEWGDFASLPDIDPESAPVRQVLNLAIKAQALKNKIHEKLVEECRDEAYSRVTDSDY